MLIVIHFGPWRSFFYRDWRHNKKGVLNQSKTTNIIAYKNVGNCPHYQNFGTPKIGSPRHKPVQFNDKCTPATTFIFIRFTDKLRRF